MSKIEEKVENLLTPIIREIGYEIYDVEYVKEGKDFFLRIFIDREEGIDLEDCEKVNNAITDVLDKENYIKDPYFLEVSSPGIERILRKNWQLERYQGQKIEIRLFKPINGKKIYQGDLISFDDNTIVIEIENRIEIPRKNISLIKTVYDW